MLSGGLFSFAAKGKEIEINGDVVVSLQAARHSVCDGKWEIAEGIYHYEQKGHHCSRSG
jgi:hypothetical protein